MDDIIKRMRKIAIFNSFPFHYEMFGFITNYAHSRDYSCDIFTNMHNNMGWLEHYSKMFPIVRYFSPPSLIGDGRIADYDLVFVTTDDDKGFDERWMTNDGDVDRVICVNHVNSIRRSCFKTHINIANFNGSQVKDNFMTCYGAIDVEEKMAQLERHESANPVVTVVGTLAPQDMIDFNRLSCEGDTETNEQNSMRSPAKITINFVSRGFDMSLLEKIDRSRFDVNVFFGLDTTAMFEVLKKTTHLMVTYGTNREHASTVSGSLPLCFTTLCIPVISRAINKHFQLENAIEFDVVGDGSTYPINLFLGKREQEQCLTSLFAERDRIISKFAKFCDARIQLKRL